MRRASILIICFLGTADCLYTAQTNSFPELALLGVFGRAITITPGAAGVLKSTSTQLTATLTAFGRPSSTSFTWSSSNTSVVTVSSSGLLSGLNNGLATITVQEPGGAVAICRVQVYSGYIYASLVGNLQTSQSTINPSTGVAAFNTTIPAGTTPTGVAVDPFGRFAYTGNFGSNNISMYTINSGTGALAANGTLAAPGSQPRNISITPDGKFLYLIAEGLNAVQLYSINQSNGTLTLLGSYPAVTYDTAIDLDGKFLITSPTATTVGSYFIDQTTGALTAAGSLSVAMGQFSIHPNGRFIFAPHLDTIVAISMDRDTGALSLIGSASLAGGSAPNGTSVSPDGAFLFTANNGDNSVSVLSINQTTGAPTLVFNAPAVGGSLVHIRVDPTGRYVYVADGAGQLLQFSVNQNTGALTNLGSLNVGGNQWNLTIL